jgi:hypothetical protein
MVTSATPGRLREQMGGIGGQGVDPGRRIGLVGGNGLGQLFAPRGQALFQVGDPPA